MELKEKVIQLLAPQTNGEEGPMEETGFIVEIGAGIPRNMPVGVGRKRSINFA